jgi:hypothetical protein
MEKKSLVLLKGRMSLAKVGWDCGKKSIKYLQYITELCMENIHGFSS